MAADLPEWTTKGGSFRSGTQPWKWWQDPKGRWIRKEMMAFGKATSSYRARFYRCPVCDKDLEPSETAYVFACPGCPRQFKYGFGQLIEKEGASELG